MSSLDLPVIQTPSQPAIPSSLVVRYGHMRLIGEFPYGGDVRPGCGAKVVISTRRGTELAEVITTTCSNGGCAKSVSREKLQQYIANSGGDDYPFSTDGRILRIANPDDYREQTRIESRKPEFVALCKQLISELQLPMKLVEVELLLGGEMATFFFLSEHRVDFRALVKQLGSRLRTRIQMHQIGSRDEARLVADYETCGQHCCCKQFLKVLKPVNMGAAKMQKATLDPNKISGRCGRLKCCLRYEEETYDQLRRKLPRIGNRVRTAEGIGFVVETMILTQLVKVRLDSGKFVAIANEEIQERDLPPPENQPQDREPGAPPPRPRRKMSELPIREEEEPAPGPADMSDEPPGPSEPSYPQLAQPESDSPDQSPPDGPENNPSPRPPGMGSLGKKKKRRPF